MPFASNPLKASSRAPKETLAYCLKQSFVQSVKNVLPLELFTCYSFTTPLFYVLLTVRIDICCWPCISIYAVDRAYRYMLLTCVSIYAVDRAYRYMLMTVHIDYCCWPCILIIAVDRAYRYMLLTVHIDICGSLNNLMHCLSLSLLSHYSSTWNEYQE
jgi:hypothetical protein